ncbi:MAG: transcription repressor NadR [Oscillospiraceae bacterium]|nr:transcription repressor NadR [Oscillospiraceae bacterium]
MLTGAERREQLLAVLEGSVKPVSGTDLARQFEVSRQVIVQDVALLRATNKNILSTNKGYILFRDDDKDKKAKRTVRVQHRDEEILQEFQCIVDCGARVLDVVVEHELYGQISVDLLIQNRQDAAHFVQQMQSCQSRSLNILTGGVHYHTIEADSEERLDRAVEALKQAGFLAE